MINCKRALRDRLKSLLILPPLLLWAATIQAAPLDFTVNMSEAVDVDTTGGTPRIAVNVGGVTRYASYSGGTGTSALTFTYTPQAGDLDLDGVAVSSPVDLNSGTIKDLSGNDVSTLTFAPPNTASVRVDYPSLSLDFINSDYVLSGTHYASLPAFLTAAGGTYTRASTATYFDVTGIMQTAGSNTPRFDYDPVTHAAKGLLLEEARTNQAFNSADPANWSLNGASVSAVGTTELGLFHPVRVSSNGQNWHRINLVRTGGVWRPVTSDVTVTFFYRAGTSGKAYIVIYNTTALTSSTLSGNVGALSVSATGTGAISNLVQSQIGSVYVISFKFSPVNNTDNIGFGISPNSTVVGEDIVVLGGQLEYGSFPTSFISTAGAAATRQVDSLSMPTGAWFNAAEGQFYSAINPYATFTNYPQIALFGDGTSANFIAYTLFPSNNFIEEWKQGAATLYALNAGSVPAGASTKLVGAYKSGSSAVVRSGGAAVTSAAALGVLPITLFSIGSNIARGGADGRLSGTISMLKYYPLRASNTQLQLLTQ